MEAALADAERHSALRAHLPRTLDFGGFIGRVEHRAANRACPMGQPTREGRRRCHHRPYRPGHLISAL